LDVPRPNSSWVHVSSHYFYPDVIVIIDNSTLFELWSLHSQQNDRKASWSNFPQRLFLPQIPVFSDPDPDRNIVTEYWLRRVRSDTGFHPYTLKTAFPSLTVLYQEDWNDYREMGVPFVIEHLAIVDHEVSSTDSAKLAAEELPQNWWEPIRKNMAVFFNNYDPISPIKKRWGWAQKKTITYIHRQDASRADAIQGRLSDDSHEELVHALERFATSYGVQLNIVSALDGDAVEGTTKWTERMKAIVMSDVSPSRVPTCWLQPTLTSRMYRLYLECMVLTF
jgi:hypothetical protein